MHKFDIFKFKSFSENMLNNKTYQPVEVSNMVIVKSRKMSNVSKIYSDGDKNISEQYQNISEVLPETTTEIVFSTRNSIIVCRTLATKRKVCFNYIVHKREMNSSKDSIPHEIRSSVTKNSLSVLHFYICTLVTYYSLI